jgi:quinol monooxygenase YgiN
MVRTISQRAYTVVRRSGPSLPPHQATNVNTLYIASVFLRVRPSKRPEVLSAIRQLMRSMRGSPACEMCRFLGSADDENTFVLTCEWSTQEALDELLKSKEFQVLRGMRMLLQKDTELILDEVAARRVLNLDS